MAALAAFVLALSPVTSVRAAGPESIAFLEEHVVRPGVPHTLGALYQVPALGMNPIDCVNTKNYILYASAVVFEIASLSP